MVRRFKRLARQRIWRLRQRWLSRNAIAIRCAVNHRSLWFYLPKPITSFDARQWSRLARAVHEGSNDLDGITAEGQTLIKTIRTWQEVIEKDGIDLRPDYIAVHLYREEDWRAVIPRIVSLIRQAFLRPDLRVRVMPPLDRAVPVWHRELLKELFGPLAP